MLKKLITTVVFASLVASTAQAATLLNAKGRVLVHQGEGFLPASAPMRLNPGDRVTVRGKGMARIAYGKDCIKTVKSYRSFVVPEDKVCPPSTATRGEAVGSMRDMPAYASTDETAMGFVVGGAFIGIASVAFTMGDHDKPASP